MEAVETVRNSFYVDYCLKSVSTAEEGLRLSSELHALTQKGGFRLTEWVSNSHELLSSVPEADRSKNVKDIDLDCEAIPAEKALGVMWTVETDTLGFHVTAAQTPDTRRGILSTVSSLYDPLGMAAPFVLIGKMIVQQSCHLKLSWDELVPDDLCDKWESWMRELSILDGYRLERCFKPEGFVEVESAQLHHFADASQVSYGCVSYLRLVDVNQCVHCTFVFGKAQVVPLKQLTIPRMELTAAVVAAKKLINRCVCFPCQAAHLAEEFGRPQGSLVRGAPHTGSLHKKTLQLNVEIVLNISWKFHSCVKTLTYKNKKLIKKCLVPMPGRPWAVPEFPTHVAPAPHARCTQKPLEFNVQIVLNISSKFRSSTNIFTCKIKSYINIPLYIFIDKPWGRMPVVGYK